RRADLERADSTRRIEYERIDRSDSERADRYEDRNEGSKRADRYEVDSRQAQIVETLRVMRDMRREMGDMHAELLALREQQRRARKPRPDVRVPDHQDVLEMRIVTSSSLCHFT
ncbi:hypothetical protein Tco_1240334, partial [Tanacetum coccineum]